MTPHPERLVFSTGDGRPLRQSNVTRRWLYKMLDKAKVERRGWHSFRHAAATDALDAGANPVEVAAMLGHSRASITTDLYASATEHDHRSVLDAIEAQRAKRARG